MAAWRPACGCRPRGAGAHAGHRAQHGGPCLRTTDLRRLCAGARGARHLRRRRVSRPVVAAGKFRWIATRRCRAGASARCARRWPRVAMGRFRARRARAEDVPDPDLEPAAGARVAPRRAGAAELRDGTRRCRTARAIADYLRGTRGIACTPAQVVITSGTQQSCTWWRSCWRIRATGCGWRTRVGARAASFMPPAWRAWRWRSTARPGAKRRARAEPPRLVFVSPSHQYPTGAHMSLARRRQLLDTRRSTGSG